MWTLVSESGRLRIWLHMIYHVRVLEYREYLFFEAHEMGLLITRENESSSWFVTSRIWLLSVLPVDLWLLYKVLTTSLLYRIVLVVVWSEDEGFEVTGHFHTWFGLLSSYNFFPFWLLLLWIVWQTVKGTNWPLVNENHLFDDLPITLEPRVINALFSCRSKVLIFLDHLAQKVIAVFGDSVPKFPNYALRVPVFVLGEDLLQFLTFEEQRTS